MLLMLAYLLQEEDGTSKLTLEETSGSLLTEESFNAFGFTAADTLSSISDTTQTVRNRPLSDSGSAVADIAPASTAMHRRTAADTLLSISETLGHNTNRVVPMNGTFGFGDGGFGDGPFGIGTEAMSSVSDTAPTRLRAVARTDSDALASMADAAAKISVRFTTDGLSAVSDAAPSELATHTRAVGDVAASISDLPLVGAGSRATFDTLTTIADSIQLVTRRPIVDIAALLADATPTGQRGVAIRIADQAVTIGEDVYAIYPAFSKLRISDRYTTDVKLRTTA